MWSVLKLIGRLAVGTAATFGLWLLFVDRTSGHELLTGLGAAILAATGLELVRGEEHPRFWPHARWFAELWRVPKDIVEGCAVLVMCLFTEKRGILRQTRFEPGGEDRHSAARRALAIAFGSISPSSIIIGIDRETGLMLVHLADHVPLPTVARRLGALP